MYLKIILCIKQKFKLLNNMNAYQVQHVLIFSLLINRRLLLQYLYTYVIFLSI